VRRELPDIRLHIIGSKMPEALARRTAPGLVVHGFVPDLEPYMNGCRISVAPLRYGAGVKGKVNQAMSHGLPVVATSCAAEGMYAEHGRDILVADDAASFAAEVCRLYGDRELWQRLAENGRRNVERHFSLDAARKALQALLGRLESGG
jgi:glycosyltransferase involved in cell wall biosynthesis